MLWRSAYEPEIHLNVTMKEVDFSDGIYVGVPTADALPDMRVWSRLLEGENSIEFRFLVCTSVVPETTWREIFKKSELVRTVFRSDLDIFTGLSLSPKRSVTFVAKAGFAPVVMVGPSTEDSFEEFLAVARHSV